ncbi:hypothetical protein HDU89_001515 [Geranomyces variabilis]|nr:hypothetical protein HDU89_001515 [Geranomyces variabilis]
MQDAGYRNSIVSDHPYLVSFIPLNNNASNRRMVNLENETPIGRLLDKDEPALTSLKFASKVVSRQHGMMGFVDGKLYIQDTKSSSGTFLNAKRLSAQGLASAKFEVHDGDVIRLGEDCEVGGVIHQSVVLKVIFGRAMFRDRLGSRSGSQDISRMENAENITEAYVDFSTNPQVQAAVDAEFNIIWNSLTAGLDHPLKRLRDLSRAKTAGGSDSQMSRGNIAPQQMQSQSQALGTYNHRTLSVGSSSGAGGAGGMGGGSRRPSLPRTDTAIPENEQVMTFDSRHRSLSFTSLSSAGTANVGTRGSVNYAVGTLPAIATMQPTPPPI